MRGLVGDRCARCTAKSVRWLGLASALVLGLGCRAPERPLGPLPGLRLASTSSLGDSGLFPIVSQAFSARTQRTLVPTFVGSGQALERARAGQADVVWVHSRLSEDAFVIEGYGINRRDVMYSEYVIVGPASDPAKIKNSISAVEAFARLARARAPFVSRGDQSGTHARELSLWKLAEVEVEPAWYTDLHAGMVATLTQASERGAYALSDLPTFLVQEAQLALKVLVRGDARLHNPYGIIAVNPARFPDTDYEGAMALVDFVTSPAGQDLIREYGRERFGTPLFHPLLETGGID
jgi:tungstate transport system substrate-binding protein